MMAFEGLGDLGFNLDDLDLPDIADVADPAAGAASAAGAVDLPDPFAGESPISAQTQGILDDVSATISAASDDYAQIAAAEGLAPDLPAGPLESAQAITDAALHASPEQAHQMATQLEGMTASQEIVNSVREHEQDMRDSQNAIEAAGKAERLAAEADRAIDAAARAVQDSRAARGV